MAVTALLPTQMERMEKTEEGQEVLRTVCPRSRRELPPGRLLR